MKITLTFTHDGRYTCDGLESASPARTDYFLLALGPLLASAFCSGCPRFSFCKLSHVAAGASEVEGSPAGLAAIKAACKELGLIFHENHKTYNWFGRWVKDYHAADAAYKHGFDPSEYGKCDHMIELPGCHYQIGLKKMASGNFGIIYDFYGEGRKIMNTLGKGCELLVQHYGLNKAQAIAKNKGYATERKTLLNGDVQLVVTGV